MTALQQNAHHCVTISACAIATARTSRKIDGAYQDVLKWARQLGSAQTFFDRLDRSGAGNDDMRTFVGTLRDHLREAGAPHDDGTHRCADAVEQYLDPRQLLEVYVERSQSKDHQKRRKDESGARERGAQSAAVHPSEIFRELRRQRPRAELRKSQTLEIIFFRNPLPGFHQISLHVANECDRSAKSERS